jgi:hypothetical protein
VYTARGCDVTSLIHRGPQAVSHLQTMSLRKKAQRDVQKTGLVSGTLAPGNCGGIRGLILRMSYIHKKIMFWCQQKVQLSSWRSPSVCGCVALFERCSPFVTVTARAQSVLLKRHAHSRDRATW